MITAKNLTKSFTGEPVFENIDFKIPTSKKIGLVGKNGCGKSTLFKLIAGIYQPDSGALQLQHEQLGYIPQEFSFDYEYVGEALEDYLENPYETYKIEKLVSEMEFKNYDAYQLISTLSEGQKMKLKVMQVMLSKPTTLLIDEPTNHLDIEGIMWFENYINNLNTTVLMISHDREFLNNTVDEIWEIENKKLLQFVGDYDNYKEQKLKLINKWNEEYVRFIKRKKQLEDLLTRSREKNISRSGKGVQSVKKRIEREIEKNKKEKFVSTKIDSVSFDTNMHSHKLVTRFENVEKTYTARVSKVADNKTTAENNVFSYLNFEIRGNQKIWLFGPNGTGKTTLVKLIVGAASKTNKTAISSTAEFDTESPTSGKIKIGPNIKIGYFAQKQTHLDYTQSVFEYFIAQTGCFYADAYSKLAQFNFEKNDLKKQIKHLSPGQRARFAFAIFAYNDYDFLILDEPSNHLDIETKEVIEESLQKFTGTLLLVSHDRFFVERVGIDKRLNLQNGRLEYY